MKRHKQLLLVFTMVMLMAGALWHYKPTIVNLIMAGEHFAELPEEVESTSRTYRQILADGATPALSPDYDFPTGYQYLNGCFGYAVIHILADRGVMIDPHEMEATIEKPREELWKSEYKAKLEDEYDLDFKWYKSADMLFYLLEKGEAVSLTYKLEDGSGILHAVAAYSFDDEGVWVSDSLTGGKELVRYKNVFTEKGDETLYGFARVVEKDSAQPNL